MDVDPDLDMYLVVDLDLDIDLGMDIHAHQTWELENKKEVCIPIGRYNHDAIYRRSMVDMNFGG